MSMSIPGFDLAMCSGPADDPDQALREQADTELCAMNLQQLTSLMGEEKLLGAIFADLYDELIEAQCAAILKRERA
jgi:hypothetical protein